MQTTPIINMMFDTSRKKVPWGKHSAKAQGLTKPEKSFSASGGGGGKLLVNFNDSTTI